MHYTSCAKLCAKLLGMSFGDANLKKGVKASCDFFCADVASSLQICVLSDGMLSFVVLSLCFNSVDARELFLREIY